MVICGLMASKTSLSLNRSAPLGGRTGFAGLVSSVPPTLIVTLPQRFASAMELRPLPPVPVPALAPVSPQELTARELTARELDVLRGVAAGCSNKVIARQLCLTPETVKWHLKNIMRKLDAKSRHEAVLRAGERGLLAATGSGRA